MRTWLIELDITEDLIRCVRILGEVLVMCDGRENLIGGIIVSGGPLADRCTG